MTMVYLKGKSTVHISSKQSNFLDRVRVKETPMQIFVHIFVNY